jgi:hypothetical protein
MFTRHYVDFCKRCNELTPHEDRRLLRWISIGLVVALLGGVTWFALGTVHAERRLALLGLSYVCTWFILDRRAKRAGLRCTRCRHKARKAWSRTQPDPRNSTIDIS